MGDRFNRGLGATIQRGEVTAYYPDGVHPELEKLAATDLSRIGEIEIAELRSVRQDCSTAETDISFVRRLTQGRLDIIGHEVQRRNGQATTGDLEDVLFDIPSILSDSPTPQRSTSRTLAIAEPSPDALKMVSELDRIVSPGQLGELGQLDQPDLMLLVDQLRSFESELSTVRRRLHEIIDSIQSEIARRYRDGEAFVDTLLQ